MTVQVEKLSAGTLLTKVSLPSCPCHLGSTVYFGAVHARETVLLPDRKEGFLLIYFPEYRVNFQIIFKVADLSL